MKQIDWNQISELGLLERINKEIMHPLGLAVYRIPDTGMSGGALVADDGVWEYDPSEPLKNYIDSTVRQMLENMLNGRVPSPTKQ